MKQLILYFIAISGVMQTAMAQERSYPFDSIPDSLKKGANAVKRYEHIYFEVSDVDKAKLVVHKVITVLNKDAARQLFFAEYTNKYLTLGDVEIRLMNANGSVINKFKKKDVLKLASGEGLVEDGMYYYIPVSTAVYPVTMELKYQINYSGTLGYPSYDYLEDRISVEQSHFSVKVNNALGLRYKSYKADITPAVKQEGNYSLYQWSVRNLPAVSYEEDAGGYSNFFPSIAIAPNKFRIYNTDGSMKNWNEFGKWGYALLKDREVLSEERKQFFANLVKDAPDEREKIRRVYRYLQQNFRYVSIQLGIGGFQPFPAQFTDDKKYGDCKGLSFYTHSVLASLGIRSYVALIYAGNAKQYVDPAFPASQFNHMILCVPQRNDTIWLECTSKICEFGFLGSSTENRLALLLTENGGVLVPTPDSDPDANRLSLHTDIFLEGNGSGKIQTFVRGSGEYTPTMIMLNTAKKEDQKNYVVHNLGFPLPDELVLTPKEDNSGGYTQIDLLIEKIPQFSSGSKMFLKPRMFNMPAKKLPSAEKRSGDYYFNLAFNHSDTTVYHLPEGFSAEVLPREITKDCGLARYSTKYRVDQEKKLIYSVASLTLMKNKIPAAQYAEVKKFFDEVLSDNTQKIVIKKD